LVKKRIIQKYESQIVVVRSAVDCLFSDAHSSVKEHSRQDEKRKMVTILSKTGAAGPERFIVVWLK